MPHAVPSGFVAIEKDGASLVLRSGLEQALLDAGVADPDALVARSPASGLIGRGALGRIALPGGAALVRLYRRGGLVGKLLRRLFFDAGRARDELALHVQALERGASVVEPLAAVTRRRGIGWTHALATREVSNARDLEKVLIEAKGRERRRALAAAGEAVRRLHDAGVDHADLNVKNVLLVGGDAGDPVRALVIDLDRGALREGLASEDRRRSLVRLLRSFVKLSLRQRVSPRDPFRFARAYARGDEARREELIAWGRSALPRIRARSFWWRLLGVGR